MSKADPRDVKKLADRVADSRKFREQDKVRAEIASRRQSEIDSAANEAPQDFWCDHCHIDYTAIGFKRLNWGFNLDTGMAYIPDGPRMAWYGGQCPKCRQWNERYILDKWQDPYFRKSVKIRRMQAEHADDMLTPDDPRFKTVYPVQWARIQAEIEEREIAKWSEEKALRL